MCNRNGHCLNHKFLANGKTWKIAFLKLEAAVIFFDGLWRIEREFFVGPQRLLIDDIYIRIYIYA